MLRYAVAALHFQRFSQGRSIRGDDLQDDSHRPAALHDHLHHLRRRLLTGSAVLITFHSCREISYQFQYGPQKCSGGI